MECLLRHGAQMNIRGNTLASGELYKYYHWCMIKNGVVMDAVLSWQEGDKDVEIDEVRLLREWWCCFGCTENKLV